MIILYILLAIVVLRLAVYTISFIFGAFVGICDAIGTTFLGQESVFDEDEQKEDY